MTYDKHDIMALADEFYPHVTTELPLTSKQLASLFNRWKRDANGKKWPEFAKSASPTIGMDGAVTVQWCGMLLLVEQDGYTHT